MLNDTTVPAGDQGLAHKRAPSIGFPMPAGPLPTESPVQVKRVADRHHYSTADPVVSLPLEYQFQQSSNAPAVSRGVHEDAGELETHFFMQFGNQS
jgi:hypothetical protein